MKSTSARTVARRIRYLFTAALAAIVAGGAATAHAASAGMPWEGPLTQIVASLSGPVAKAVAGAAIVFAGLGLAMSESGHSHKRLIGLVVGLCIVFATQWFLSFLGFSGGLAV